MAVTLGQICDAVADTLVGATGFTNKQSFDELAEGVQEGDLPILQVYWNDMVMDPSGATDRTSFSGGIRQTIHTIHADVISTRRSELSEDNEKQVNHADAIITVLQAQNQKPYFGLSDTKPDGSTSGSIKAFQLTSATRVLFEYADASYLGTRFIITVWIY